MKRFVLCLTTLSLLSACASQMAQNDLRYAKAECSRGNLYACEDIPNKSRVVDDEVRATTALLLVLPLVILAGGLH